MRHLFKRQVDHAIRALASTLTGVRSGLISRPGHHQSIGVRPTNRTTDNHVGRGEPRVGMPGVGIAGMVDPVQEGWQALM